MGDDTSKRRDFRMIPLAITIFIVVADQATKWMVETTFALGESRDVFPGFFNFTYLRNPGAAWGMFGNHNAALTILSLVMLAVIFIFRRSFLSNTWEHRLALGLMAGGIIGNLIDRIKFGYVIDFLDFYVRDWHWPVFNIADSAICVGVGIYMVSSIWLSTHPLHDQRPESSTSYAPREQ